MTPRRDPLTFAPGPTRVEGLRKLLGKAEARQPWYRRWLNKWRWKAGGVPVRRQA